MTLRELAVGETCVINSVGGEGALRQHFLDMGVIPGVEVTLVKLAPMGDPMELRIHGYELTLRLADAEQIEVVTVTKDSEDASDNKDNDEIKKNSGKSGKSSDKEEDKDKKKHKHHPGLGEGGIYHDHTKEKKLPHGTLLTFALAGNQNSGKTTLFNQLTGSNQHVGNFPGVTVDRKSGVIKGHNNTEVVDLPGIYSLSPYTDEEIVSRQYIIGEKPKGIINIVDAMNIERNLYLTMQLIELDVPIVLALNMMDEVRGNGGSININAMEALLGIPVVPISAAKNEGVDELISHALHVAKYQESPGKKDFCDESDHGGAVHRCLHGIMHLIEDHAKAAEIPVRFAANKVIEGDNRVIDALNLSQNEKEMVEHIIVQMEEERGLDRSAAIADMRFSFIDKLVKETVVKPAESKERERSEKIDKILTGKFTAIPSFVLIMAVIAFLTFNSLGAWLQGLLESGIGFVTDKLDAALTAWNVNDVIHSLIIDGIFSGVGSVLSFLPIIILLFFFLSLLEDTGYMARVAFVMDRPLRKLGLSGRSIVPMLIGFGCSVPGVMSSRTMPSERDRKMTIMLIPFMSCTAKYPIYGFLVAAFFPGKGALIIIALYLLGIIVGIVTALVSKRFVFKGEAVPFVMELPNYRMPGAKNVAQLMWEKAKDFLVKAFTIIFVATIVIWFLQTFNLHLGLAEDPAESILAKAAGLIAPVFAPLGFGDWRVVTALITGFMAKESVVSTLTILTEGNITGFIGTAAAASLLVFCLLYTPCVAAIASVKRELGRKWALVMVALQCTVAWLVALLVYLIASLV
ncbi:ferrous iron transport protein B [Lachnospiraceae bacterium NE2001]|nr:ferrous iron transport protein B [Lachnospiraceae bacterium NE2001]